MPALKCKPGSPCGALPQQLNISCETFRYLTTLEGGIIEMAKARKNIKRSDRAVPAGNRQAAVTVVAVRGLRVGLVSP